MGNQNTNQIIQGKATFKKGIKQKFIQSKGIKAKLD
jgi:hypothetical protein